MIPLSAAVETELRKGHVRPIDLLEATWPGGTERASLGDQDVVVGGVTYPRRHGYMEISGLEADSDNVATTWRIKLSAIDPAWLDDLYNDNLQGTSITRSRVLIDRTDGSVVDDTKIDLDVRELHVEEIVEQEGQADVSFVAETIFIDQMDPTRDARTHAAHIKRHPGDKFFRQVNAVQRGLEVQLTTLRVRTR